MPLCKLQLEYCWMFCTRSSWSLRLLHRGGLWPCFITTLPENCSYWFSGKTTGRALIGQSDRDVCIHTQPLTYGDQHLFSFTQNRHLVRVIHFKKKKRIGFEWGFVEWQQRQTHLSHGSLGYRAARGIDENGQFRKKIYQKGSTSMTVSSNKWKMFNGSNHLIFGTVNLMRQWSQTFFSADIPTEKRK